MKILFRNSIHERSKSHDCVIGIIGEKKVKMTYEAYNAVERFNVEFFDGDKWNHILSMLDMGVQSNSSAYVCSEQERKKSADDLIKKADIMCKAIL